MNGPGGVKIEKVGGRREFDALNQMKIVVKTAVLVFHCPTKVMDLVEEMAQLPILFQDQIMRDLKKNL